MGAPVSDTDERGKHPDPSDCTQEFQITKVLMHPEYNRQTNENDIAILTLDGDIDFTRDCVCPVCLSYRKPKFGELCSVSGYV